jgi:hypothetical protein
LSSNPTLDRESFQKLLASAFAVQESGMKPQSLAAILELQRSIRMGHLDVDGATHLIAEWARSVANASGVAAGRLKGDQLIYTAGSGSAASYIGRRVMATFSTSAPNEVSSEILRVEDTTTDARIEAAVCRQFGVKALLILPIYRGRFVAGVLQVLFKEAHSFQDQEVRTYWILAGLVGEAMSQTPVIQKASELVAPAVADEGIEHLPAPPREPANALENVEVAHAPSPVQRVCTEHPPEVPLHLPLERLPLLHSRFRLRMQHLPAYKLPAYKRERISGLVAASVILVFTWILYTAAPARMSSGVVTTPQSPNLTAQQTPPSGASQVPLTAPAATGFPAQVKYQTVRYVAPASQGRSQALESGRVKHFGSDVTVRYFAPRAATIKTTAGDSEVHHVSDDVTVRYFKSRNLGPQGEPVASDPHQTVAR